MKKQLFNLIAVWGLAAAITPLFAQSPQGLKATVPFDFYVGSVTMPAGVYIVEPSTRHLIIQNQSGTARAIQLTNSTEKKSTSGGAEMVFMRYGSTVFLARVITLGSNIGHQLPKTKLEKELAARLPQTEISTALEANLR